MRQIVLLKVALWLLPACSSLKERSLFKSKSSNTEQQRNQSSGQLRLVDYSEILKMDSSTFSAWIWVDGDFSFHQDSGIKGEKALIQYVDKRNSVLLLKDSLISEQDSSSFAEHTSSQTSFLKTKEKQTRGFSWVLWIVGLLLAWFFVRKYKIKLTKYNSLLLLPLKLSIFTYTN